MSGLKSFVVKFMIRMSQVHITLLCMLCVLNIVEIYPEGTIKFRPSHLLIVSVMQLKNGSICFSWISKK